MINFLACVGSANLVESAMEIALECVVFLIPRSSFFWSVASSAANPTTRWPYHQMESSPRQDVDALRRARTACEGHPNVIADIRCATTPTSFIAGLATALVASLRLARFRQVSEVLERTTPRRYQSRWSPQNGPKPRGQFAIQRIASTMVAGAHDRLRPELNSRSDALGIEDGMSLACTLASSATWKP
jgi:hypothetical protein